MADCELLNTCGFFKKYQATKNLACKGFITLFCKGPNMDSCERKKFRMANGRPPVDEMMPNGKMIS